MSDRSLGLLTEAILERDQPRTADLFFGMVRREGRTVADALGVVTAAVRAEDHAFRVRGVRREQHAPPRRLLAAAVRLLAGWPKMAGERECYARFAKEWMQA